MSMLREAPIDGKKGPVSMRRVGAFIFILAAVAAGLWAVATGQPWQTVAAGFGVPGSLAAMLLFFTSWSDIKSIVSAYKGGA